MEEQEYIVKVAANIKKQRLLKKCSLNELGLRCGMEKQSIHRVESGKYNIQIGTLYKISKALEVSIEELVKA